MKKPNQRFLGSLIRNLKRKLQIKEVALKLEREKSVTLKEEILQLRFDIGEAKNRADIAEFLISYNVISSRSRSLFLEKVINYLIEILECPNKDEILQNIADRCLSEVKKIKGSNI